MKAHVEAGFGIAILPGIAYNRNKDRGLEAISAKRLFEATSCFVMTQAGRRLPGYVHDLVQYVREAVSDPLKR